MYEEVYEATIVTTFMLFFGVANPSYVKFILWWRVALIILSIISVLCRRPELALHSGPTKWSDCIVTERTLRRNSY